MKRLATNVAALMMLLVGATVGALAQSAQPGQTSTSVTEGYRIGAERQVAQLKAKFAGRESAEPLAAVKTAYEQARTQQRAWLDALTTAANGQSADALHQATSTVAQAVFDCALARRTALELPAWTPALADGVRNGVVKDYTADTDKRLKDLRSAGNRKEAVATHMNEALSWKAWDDIK
jgi:hypothetical protein